VAFVELQESELVFPVGIVVGFAESEAVGGGEQVKVWVTAGE
jgi:hypothetical protein